MSTSQPRRLVVLRGTPAETAPAARAMVAHIEQTGGALLWVSDNQEEGASGVPLAQVKRHLGQSFDVVVLDFHGGLVPDVLGMAHGLVWGGGTLILRLPEQHKSSGAHARETVTRKMCAWPYSASDVGCRFERHFESALERSPLTAPQALSALEHDATGSDDQDRVVATLLDLLGAGSASSADERAAHGPGTAVLVALTADRGRGKSAALGRVLAKLSIDPEHVVVTAGQQASAAEVLRFAMPTRPRFLTPMVLLTERPEASLIVIDEAAQIPVPVLRLLVHAYPDASMVFATTTHGYEGTGRGFALRFLPGLESDGRPLHRMGLQAPIRWGPEDPLERFAFDALLLDAEPATFSPAAVAGYPADLEKIVEHIALDRDALVADSQMLREFFGLMVQAHYRTTPGDLQRMLDAPNLRLHALVLDGHVVAATWVAVEGGLPQALCDDVYHGRRRLRGHALPETLVSHLGQRDAARMDIIRSVRIAVHASWRRRGLGTRLIDEVHNAYAPDFFGTLFGATSELLKFRRSVGYALIRVGASRGSRTGEPAAVMMRPVSDRARTLLHTLRAKLARELPLQLRLMQAGHELVLEPDLLAALGHDLPEVSPMTAPEREEAVLAYLHGPRTYEAAALALVAWVEARREALQSLEVWERALVESRVLRCESWAQAAAAADLPSIPATMRALRRVCRKLAPERV